MALWVPGGRNTRPFGAGHSFLLEARVLLFTRQLRYQKPAKPVFGGGLGGGVVAPPS